MRLKTALLAMYVFVSVRVAVAAPATGSCSLPQNLQREILNKYPGARLVTPQDIAPDDRALFQNEHGNDCPGLTKVDFYGDGRPTLAFVLIVGTGESVSAKLVVAHETAQKWKAILIDTAKASIPVVWSQGPGKYEDVYGEKKIQATKPVIVFCEYNAWAIVFAWNGNRVDKIWLRD